MQTDISVQTLDKGYYEYNSTRPVISQRREDYDIISPIKRNDDDWYYFIEKSRKA